MYLLSNCDNLSIKKTKNAVLIAVTIIKQTHSKALKDPTHSANNLK